MINKAILILGCTFIAVFQTKNDIDTAAIVLYTNITVHNGSWDIVSEYADPVDVYFFRLHQGPILLTWFNFHSSMNK